MDEGVGGLMAAEAAPAARPAAAEMPHLGAVAPAAAPTAGDPPVLENVLGLGAKRPGPPTPVGAGSAKKKSRVRKTWDECTNCDSKHGMRYGYVDGDRTLRLVACDKCRKDWTGPKLKDMTRVCTCGSGKDARYGPPGGPATHCVECKDAPAPGTLPEGTTAGQLVNLRPSTGLCNCGSEKVKRFGWAGSAAVDGEGKKKSARTNCIKCKVAGMVNLSLSKKPEEAWGGKCACGSGKARRFGLKEGGKRTHCIACKTADMVNLTTRLCARVRPRPPFFFGASSLSLSVVTPVSPSTSA